MRSRRLTHIIRLLAICFIAIPLADCALINAYYNARVAYGIAQRAHRKQMRQYPDSLMEPSGEAATQYDRTIVKTQKVLEVYRRSLRWHDDAMFTMGKAYFYKRQFGDAIRQMRRLQEEFPLSKHVPESYFYMAQAYVYEERYQKAEEILAMMAERYPQLKQGERIAMLQAKLALRREGKAQAVELLLAALESAQSDQRKIELRIQIAQLYRDLKQYGQALTILRDTPRNRDLTQLMYQADFLRLQCHMDMDSVGPAMVLAEQMLRDRNYQNKTSEVLLKKAALLALSGKTDEAITAYERLTREYENSPEASMAWYELGVLYQMVRGDFTKAAECYLKASTASDTAVAATASRRARALARVDTLRVRQSEPRDSVDSLKTPAQWDLELAELFWLDLSQPDSAYHFYLLAAADTSAPDSLEARALFAAGYLAVQTRSDTTAADSLFAVLLTRFPSDAFAKQAQKLRGSEITVRTRADSALEAFVAAEKLLNDTKQPAKAVEAYLRVFNDYEDREEGQKALYAAAWVSDNVTYSKDLARFLYRKVCDKYPGTVYCEQASKPRLRAVADSSLIRREREAAEGAAEGIAPEQMR